MRKAIIACLMLLGIMTLPSGCVQVTRGVTSREAQFDHEAALNIHREAYAPIYQFILDFYPTEGPRHEQFQTKADVLDYMSETLPAGLAEQVAGYFVGEEPDSLDVAYDVFFPTPFHSGVTLADAYIERVKWPGTDEVDRYLVVVDRYVDELASIGRPRETRYMQDDTGVWRLHSISGTMVVRGAMYSPHGLKN
jgi:hypothetical protein